MPLGALTCVLNAVTGGGNQLGDTGEASLDIESLMRWTWDGQV